MSIILLLHLFMLTFTFGHVELLTVDYHSIDTPIVGLTNHTLREVFEDGNIVLNPNFDTTSDWYNLNNTLTVTNSIGSVLATSQFGGPRQNINVTINDFHYVKIRYNAINNNQRVLVQHLNNTTITPTIFNQYVEYSLKGQVTQNVNDEVRFIDFSISDFVTFYVDYYYSINMTSLGISSLTLEQMDSYFEMYQQNISADDVTYVQNEMTITDLTYILCFSFVWVVIIWSIRKVVL